VTAGTATQDSAVGAEVIAFRAAGKTFPDGTEAVRDVSFTLRRGEFLSVVGPSGCGKSTLLRMASGLGPHTAGEVASRVENLGYVFQDATLLPWRSVRKNVELPAELEGSSRDQRTKLATALRPASPRRDTRSGRRPCP